MKSFSRKLLALVMAVAIVAMVLLPTTSWAAQTSSVSSQYEEFTPRKEKEIEKFYWEIILSKIHIDSKYYRKVDGFRWRDEVQLSAEIILDEMLCFPGGDPNDPNTLEWQRHWGNFFWRIASGHFSNRELRWNLHRVRQKARRNRVPLW